MTLPLQKPSTFLLLLCISILSFAILGLDFGIARASLLPGFGGTVYNLTPCANGFLFLVGPPRPGLFMFMTGLSKLYAFFLPHPGAWVLGNYFFGGACVCPYYNCYAGAISANGTILHMGTSL